MDNKRLTCSNCILLSSCDYSIPPCLYEPHDLLIDDEPIENYIQYMLDNLS